MITRSKRRHRLRAIMKRRKLNCSQLAAMVDRKPQTVRRWSCGSLDVPSWVFIVLSKSE